VHGAYLSAPQGIATTKLTGHVPAATQGARDLGAFADDESMDITVALPLNHVAELETLIAALHDPSSPQYGRYLSPEEFSERFGPTASQVAQVQSYLESQGMKVTSISGNRKLVKASGPHASVARAFSTEVHRYATSAGKPFFAPKYELTLPANIPIEAVHGLHNLSLYKTHSHAHEIDFAHPLATGSGPGGGVTPSDLRTAYRFPSAATYDGSGQILALFELDGYAASDIAAYEKAYDLPSVLLSNILVDGASGASGAGAAEVTLDIELMIAAAPGATKIIVYEGPNSDQGVIDTYNRIATDNVAKSISSSWGQPEDDSPTSVLQSESSIFMQMSAQGQSIFAAAGDSGAYDDGKTLSVDDPGTQPYVVSVGGTHLTTASAGGAYQSETTWNNGSASAGAGGGGISRVWSIPSYQTAIASSSAAAGSGASTSMRNVPDVSLDADPQTGYSIYFEGKWTIYGGTSCAAPIWAGFTALVNQARVEAGLGTLGVPHPALYGLSAASYASDFNDIDDGSTNLAFKAIAGFDDATGLGSMRADGLLADLAQVPKPAVPAPTAPVETGTTGATTTTTTCPTTTR
jgi:kumamolisin